VRFGLFDAIHQHLDILLVFKHAPSLEQGEQDLIITAVASNESFKLVPTSECLTVANMAALRANQLLSISSPCRDTGPSAR
jgi:hypothetical protein